MISSMVVMWMDGAIRSMPVMLMSCGEDVFYSPTFLALVHQHVCVCSPPHHPARDGRGWKDFGDLEGSRSEVVLGRSWEAFWGFSGVWGVGGVCVCVCGGLGARVRLGSFLGALGHLFGCLGCFLGRLGHLLGCLGRLLGGLARLLACLAASWAVLGPSWGVLGQSWDALGPYWGVLWPSWGVFKPSALKQSKRGKQRKARQALGAAGGVGEGRKLEAATNPHSLVSLEGAGGEVELNIIKPKGELYR